MEKETPAPPVKIPWEALSADALKGVIDDFLLREGTDYGRNEVEYEKKVMQIQRQLEREDALIVFDPNTESVTLLTAREWQRWQANNLKSL